MKVQGHLMKTKRLFMMFQRHLMKKGNSKKQKMWINQQKTVDKM